MHVEQVARESLAGQGIEYEHLLTTPTPFNTLLWRVVATDSRGYYEGFHSLLDEDSEIALSHYRGHPQLLEGLENHWPVQRLQWFTKGMYSVQQQGDAVILTDLRMGLEPDYVFVFKVGRIANPHPRPVSPERVPGVRDLSRLRWVWDRIWREGPRPEQPPAATASAQAAGRV
jgi:inner membrane protein